MTLSTITRSAIAGLATCSALLITQVPADAGQTRGINPPSALQTALNAALNDTPGGVQVSDNAIAWDGGKVILVLPSPGQNFAPPGLGTGLRKEALTTPLLQEQAQLTRQSMTPRVGGTVSAKADAGSCPGGIFTTDYYCFYEHRDYGGRRLQFTGNTSEEHASNYGFNNQTSSWVSNDVDCYLQAYDTRTGARLWQQPENSTSSYVGNANNDRMSYWTCN